MKLADPRPGICSSCYGAGSETTRFVDFEVFYDGMPVLDSEGKLAIVPGVNNHVTHDALYLCDACVKHAAELLAFKPELHRRQLAEIDRLTLERDSARAHARRLEVAMADRPDDLTVTPSRRRATTAV